MAKSIHLANICHGNTYEVSGFADSDSDYAEKLYKMGFVEGTAIELAPVNLSDPIIIQIRGSRVALRKKEAQQVFVRKK